MASSWSFDELETGLRDLGARLDYPVADTVADVVGQRLREASRRPGLVARWRPTRILRPVFVPTWQRATVAVAVVIAVLSGLLLFSPSTRHAVAGWLGIRGVKIEVTPTPTLSLSPKPAGALGGTLHIGLPVTLQEAQEAVPFHVLIPLLAGFERPDEIDLIPTFSGRGQVTLLYRARPGLPAASPTGVGLLLTEFQAKPNEEFLLKKIAPQGTTVEAVTVNGEPGFWLSGAPHEIYYVGPDGSPIFDTVRLAGNTLLWQQGPVTLRIEGEVTKAQALAIARSVG
jgi:hypothetical protein